MEKKRTSKGSGRHKDPNREKLRSADLIPMLKDYSTKDLAKRFGVSLHAVLFEVGIQFEKRNVGFGYKSKTDLEEDELECGGAWMNSSERSCFKLILNNYQLYLTKKNERET